MIKLQARARQVLEYMKTRASRERAGERSSRIYFGVDLFWKESVASLMHAMSHWRDVTQSKQR
jgi:hypothetical protein